MSKQTTGEFMATLRKANGYTQQEVAEKLNISNRTLSSWETDRTLPDVLMLPAIADLYGVSVDELLRGEKRNDEKQHSENVISEKSMKNVYKNKFGVFCTKNTLILGLALMCAALFVLGCALALWTYAPSWLDWLLLILGITGLCACCAVATYQYFNVKTSICAILDEDLTADNKAFVTALRRKLEIFLFCCAIPFALFGFILLIYFLAVNPQDKSVMGLINVNVRYLFIVFICINIAIAAVFFVICLIFKRMTVKSYYSETQKETAKTNRKLIGKLAAFGSIPLALVIILNVALAIAFPKGQKVLYRCDDLAAFRTHMQTLIINKDEYPYLDAPEGEYFLAFPYGNPKIGYYELPQTGIEYDLGNGFYGFYNKAYFYMNQTHEESWSIYYGKAEDDTSFYLGELYVYEIDVGNYVVNARYEGDDHIYYANGDLVFKLGAEEVYGQYSFSKDVSPTLNVVEKITLLSVPSLTLLICGIIFAIKRKKQKYIF